MRITVILSGIELKHMGIWHFLKWVVWVVSGLSGEWFEWWVVWVVSGERVRMSTNRPRSPTTSQSQYGHYGHTNHTFGEVITPNHPVLSEIWEVDCDSNTLKYLPQILTEQKGGSLDAPKCFLFLRFREFLKFLIFLTWHYLPIWDSWQTFF